MATAEPTPCVHCPLVITGQGSYARYYTPRLAPAPAVAPWWAAIAWGAFDFLAALAIVVILGCSMVGAGALGAMLAAWIGGGQ